MFLVIFGAKLIIIQCFSSAMPFYDQWDEAGNVFIPWLQGHLTWSHLFAAHNEHRILFTRLLDILELRLNDQWDSQLQMVVNALIQAGFACVLAYCFWRFHGRRWGSLICLILTPFFALPFAAENTLHGFQSQEYFLNLFSVAAIVGLGFGTPWKAVWWAGLAAAGLSLFTMAAGLLAAAAVAGLVAGRMIRETKLSRNHLVTLGFSMGVFLIGLLLTVSVKDNQPFQAHSVQVFLRALIHNLAWPFIHVPGLFVFVCLPPVILGVLYFRAPFQQSRRTEFILVLALWGLLQALALAYGRGAVLAQGFPVSRYLDSLMIIPIASVASLFALAEFSRFRPILNRLLMVGTGIMVGATFYAMWDVGQVKIMPQPLAKPYLEWNKMLGAIEEANVRAFVATGHADVLLHQPLFYIPYPDGDRLARYLRNPDLSAVLPPVCRRSLPLTPSVESDPAFISGGFALEMPGHEFAQVWGSYSTNGAIATGNFLSAPMNAWLPVLSVQMCCSPTTNDIRVQLVETQTGRVTEIIPHAVGRWQTILVHAPKNPFSLRITDQSLSAWVAVGEIHEIGLLSMIAMQLLDHGLFILLAGLGICIVAAGWSIFRCGGNFRSQNFPEFLMLLAAVAALVLVLPLRKLDAAQLDGAMHKELATYFAAKGDLVRAERHYREALWRNPEPENFSGLAEVISRKSLHETNTLPIR